MIGINILTLPKQESQSDSARLLPGENGSKIDKFPGKDLISIKPCFLMENHSRQCFPSALCREQVSRRDLGHLLVRHPSDFPELPRGGKAASLLPGKGRDGEGRMHPCAPQGWTLQCLTRADAEPLVHERGTGSPTAAGFVPSFTSMFVLTSCQIKCITAGLNFHASIWGNFKNGCFQLKTKIVAF